MTTMPPKPPPAAMTADELRELMLSHGHNKGSLAHLLGVHRNTVWRWLREKDPINIDAAAAALIRERMKTKKKSLRCRLVDDLPLRPNAT